MQKRARIKSNTIVHPRGRGRTRKARKLHTCAINDFDREGGWRMMNIFHRRPFSVSATPSILAIEEGLNVLCTFVGLGGVMRGNRYFLRGSMSPVGR